MADGVELFDDWEAVAAAAAGALDHRPLLFERLAWFRLLARHCPPPGRLLAARATDTWLLLAREGGRARAYANWYSLRFGAIGDPSGIASIAAALRRQGLSRIEMAPVEDAEPLAAGFRRAGWIVTIAPATASWRLATQGRSFEAYWAARPSRLRNTAERRAKALEVEIHRGFTEQGWAAYEDVYAASWKPAEGSPDFLRALAEQQGPALRLGIAKHQGRPVAAQMWLVEHGTATIHKLAYRQDSKALAPGTVLSMAMFRAAIDQDRVARIDYGTGDEAYKAEWMDERRDLWRVRAFDPRRLDGLAGAARAAASALVARLARR